MVIITGWRGRWIDNLLILHLTLLDTYIFLTMVVEWVCWDEDNHSFKLWWHLLLSYALSVLKVHSFLGLTGNHH